MRIIKNALLAGGLTLFVAAGVIVTIGKTTTHAQASDNNQLPSESTPVVYTYTAQAGDSYSLIARKAIQTYGIKNNVNLSSAQIIYAETNLTQANGSPKLLKGQKVEIKEDQIKEWVDTARDLNQEKQAAWNVYAEHANFNTNNVGQSS